MRIITILLLIFFPSYAFGAICWKKPNDKVLLYVLRSIDIANPSIGSVTRPIENIEELPNDVIKWSPSTNVLTEINQSSKRNVVRALVMKHDTIGLTRFVDVRDNNCTNPPVIPDVDEEGDIDCVNGVSVVDAVITLYRAVGVNVPTCEK